MIDAERSSSAPAFAIRRLWPIECGRVRDHLLRLGPEDRALRFCRATSERFIATYCDNIDWLRASVLGVFVAGEVRGVAELIRVDDQWPPAAELALSVEAPYQNCGVGSALVRHSLVLAQNRLIGTVYTIFLLENRKMLHIARKFAATLAIRGGQVEGEIPAPRPSYLSLVEEIAAEGEALIRAALEVPTPATPGTTAPGTTAAGGRDPSA